MFYIKRLTGFQAPFRFLNVLISCVAPAAILSIQCFSKKEKKQQNIFQKFNNKNNNYNNTWSKLQFTTVILNFKRTIFHYHLPLLPSPFPTICNIQYYTNIIILDSCHTLYLYFCFGFFFFGSMKNSRLFQNISMLFSKIILSLEMPLDFHFGVFY